MTYSLPQSSFGVTIVSESGVPFISLAVRNGKNYDETLSLSDKKTRL
ncbi:hypothetical protein [Alteromonas gracilis]